MKILVLNSGSSTLKYQLIDSKEMKVLVEGICERIGLENALIIYKFENNNNKMLVNLPSHKEAIEQTLKILQDKVIGAIKSVDEIEAIGHRVVHGGENFSKAVIVDKKVLNEIKKLSSLAPLHNPASALGI